MVMSGRFTVRKIPGHPYTMEILVVSPPEKYFPFLHYSRELKGAVQPLGNS